MSQRTVEISIKGALDSGFQSTFSQASDNVKDLSNEITRIQKRAASEQMAALKAGNKEEFAKIGLLAQEKVDRMDLIRMGQQERAETARTAAAGRAALQERLAGFKAIRAEAERASATEKSGMVPSSGIVDDEKTTSDSILSNAKWLRTQMKIAIYMKAITMSVELGIAAVRAFKGDWASMEEAIEKVPEIGEAWQLGRKIKDEIDGTREAEERFLKVHAEYTAANRQLSGSISTRQKLQAEADKKEALRPYTGFKLEFKKLDMNYLETWEKEVKPIHDPTQYKLANDALRKIYLGDWNDIKKRQDDEGKSTKVWLEKRAEEAEKFNDKSSEAQEKAWQDHLTAKDHDEITHNAAMAALKIELTETGYQKELDILKNKQAEEIKLARLKGEDVKGIEERQVLERQLLAKNRRDVPEQFSTHAFESRFLQSAPGFDQTIEPIKRTAANSERMSNLLAEITRLLVVGQNRQNHNPIIEFK